MPLPQNEAFSWVLIDKALEQQTFARLAADIRDLEAAQAASRRRLNALFHSLLHRPLTGQL